MFENYHDIVTVEELCEMLVIGRTQAYKILKSNEIASVRIGRAHKIPKAAVIQYIDYQISVAKRGEVDAAV